MKSRAAALCALLLVGCAVAAREEVAPERAGVGFAAADSIVLERTPCFGTCPAYRLRIASSGAVRFVGRVEHGKSYSARDSISPNAIGLLLERAERAGFFALPDTIRNSQELCRVLLTDHPTLVVSIFRTRRVKRVEYETGCYQGRGSFSSLKVAPQLVELEAFAAAIDSVATTSRWVRPSASGQ